MDKAKIAAFCRKGLGATIQFMSEAGFSYNEIEDALRLNPNNGMTAWRLAGNKHPKTDRVTTR